MPKISVIIPTYNRAKYLDQAIASVLCQTYQDFELIISDNCSTDNTQNIVKKYLHDNRVNYFRNAQNIGMVPNWKKSLHERATGEWFIILSDDDYFIDNSYLEDVAKEIRDPQITLVYGGGYIFDVEFGCYQLLALPFSGKTDGKTIFVSRGKTRPQDFTLCNIAFRRDIAISCNAFSNLNNYSCDTELFLNSCLKGFVSAINRPVSVYRVHKGNLIKQVLKNPNLAIGDLNSYLTPYSKAKALLTEHELNTFLNNSGLALMIERAILLVHAHEVEHLYEAINNIEREYPEIVRPLLRKNSFKAKNWFARNFGGAYLHYLKFRTTLGFTKSLLKIKIKSTTKILKNLRQMTTKKSIL